jgi:hypothetical protein
MVEFCNILSNVGRQTCVVGSLSLASLSFGLLSTICNQNNNESCPVLNNRSRTLIHSGLLGIGVTSLVFASKQLIR